MDALALAEVLVPCLAWKPPAKPQNTNSAGPGGPLQGLQGLAKALTLNKTAGAAAAAGLQAGGSVDAAAGGGAAVGEAAAAVGDAHQQQQSVDDGSRVVPLDDAELEAVVTVVAHMISNYGSVFAQPNSISSSIYSSNGNTSSSSAMTAAGVHV